jgi:hypothetical protein
MVERYEMADRPGRVDVKEMPAVDFFTEEQIKDLPENLQEVLKKDNAIYQ